MPILVGNMGSGLSALGGLQLGGPPAYPSATWTRSLPTAALPFLAHLYQNNGVTFIKSLGVLASRPAISFKASDGSYSNLTIDLPARDASISQGNVVRLTEQGGDGSTVYGGVVNSLPDVVSPTGTKHQVELTPFAFELGDAYVQVNYTTATDVAQMVRDAVAATLHCHCDQTSVPARTGITGIGDFRNRPAMDLINTARTIAGFNWFWHVGPSGRVWFQPMGSGVGGPLSQVYTAKLGVDFEERSSNGGDINALKNDLLVIGGVLPSGVTASATYGPGSQATYGKRSLNPPLSVPQVTDVPTLQAIANGVGATLDRVWNRFQLKLLPGFGTRLNPEQPGGAMIRYFEPAVLPQLESETGSGIYTGPYILQDVTLDGAVQLATAGDAPVTDVHSLETLIRGIVGRQSLFPLTYVPAALNVVGTLNGGGFQTGQSGARAVFDQNGLHLYDANGVLRINLDPIAVLQTFSDGIYNRIQQGNLASYTDPAGVVSPSGYGGRVVDASGNLVWDTSGLTSVMKSLGITDVGSQNFTSTTFATVTSSGITFTLTRQVNLYAIFLSTGYLSATGNIGYIRCNLVGVGTSGNLNFGPSNIVTLMGWRFYAAVPAGTYTIQMEGAVNTTPTTLNTTETALQLFQLGA